MKNFKWKWQDTLIVILWLLSLGYALINYGKLPDQLPVQFSITGEVNRYGSKGSAIALLAFMVWHFPLECSSYGISILRKRITGNSKVLLNDPPYYRGARRYYTCPNRSQ